MLSFSGQGWGVGGGGRKQQQSKQTHKGIFDNKVLSVFLANLAPETLATHFSSFLERLGFHVSKKNKVFYNEATQRSGFGFGMT